MKKYFNALIKLIKDLNKKDQARDILALATYYKDKKPYILEGQGVRNWAKKTKAEKVAILKSAYKAQTESVIAEIVRLLALEDFTAFQARVEWSRSYMWGYNPSARSWVNNYNYGEGSASGCGYDKLSASINTSLSKTAEDIMKGAILRRYIKDLKPLPYGLHLWARGLCVSFGGCGVETLRDICEYCGLNDWRHISGRMFDYVEAGRR